MKRSCRDAMLFGLTCLLLALNVPRPCMAAPPNVLLNDPGPPGTFATQCAPVIRSLGDKVVAVWNDSRNAGLTTETRVHYGVSVDSGATFIDYGALPTPVTMVSWRWRGDPQLAIDVGTNAIFALGYVSTLTGSPQAGIAVVRGIFIGSTLSWGAPVIVRTGVTIVVPGTLALESGAVGLHFLFANYAAGGVIEYQRSIDGNGAVWSAPVALSSVSDQGSVMYPRLAAGSDNDLHAAWAGRPGLASEPIRYRLSPDLGLSWGAEQTPAIMRMNPALPGEIQNTLAATHRTGLSMAVNRATGSTTLGRVALAWSESWDFSDEAFAALTSTLLRNEVEPNDSASVAQAFTPGDALQGTLSVFGDVDSWKASLAAGDPILVWADSVAAAVAVRVAVLDTDGFTAIANGYGGSAGAAFAFRAPVAGTYYLRISLAGGVPPGYYRVRTRIGLPASGEARDLRDVAAIYSTPTGWSSIVRPAFGPVGYDDYLPTIGFGADGLDYVTWYDMSRVPGFTSRSQLVVARNLAGDDPVLSPPLTVTNASTDWTAYNVILPPSWGTSNDVSADLRRVFLAWTDGRDHNPDAYAASIVTTAAITSCPNDTTVAAGTTVTLHVGLLNQNPLFDEKAFVEVSGGRAWPGALTIRDSVPPGVGGMLSVPIAVPDTAAAGIYPLTLTIRRQSGIILGTRAHPACEVALNIQGNVAVGRGGARGFGLDPIFPNPAHASARIGFALPSAGRVSVAVYGIAGNRVRTLMNGDRPAGPYALVWDGLDDAGRRVATGLYLVRLEGAGKTSSRRVVMLR